MKPKFDWESQIRNKGLRATKSAVLFLKTLQHLKKPLSHLLPSIQSRSTESWIDLLKPASLKRFWGLIEFHVIAIPKEIIMSSLNVSLATNTFSFLVAPLY